MARLLTCGFECGSVLVEPAPGAVTHLTGTPTIDTGTFRTGARALKLDASGATSQQVRFASMGNTTAVNYYHRLYCYFTAFPNSATDRAICQRPGLYGAWINNTGTVCLQYAGTVIGSRSPALSLNTWYRIEFLYMVNTTASAADAAELRIDGVVIATDSGVDRGTTVSGNVDLGTATGSTGMVLYVDDLAVNDSTGAAQTSWAGDAKVALLQPISDNARTGFTGGGGGTTSLFDALNNYPPTGAATPGTNASQIGSINSNTTDNFAANLTTYTTAGIGASDTINLVQPFHRVANGSAATALVMGVQGTSNPAVTEVTGNTAAAVAVGEVSATTWLTRAAAPVYAPSVTLGTSPVLRSRKGQASANNTMIDMQGMYVDYTPALIPDLNFPVWIQP